MVSHVKHRLQDNGDSQHISHHKHKKIYPEELTDGSRSEHMTSLSDELSKSLQNVPSRGKTLTLTLPRWLYCHMPIAVVAISVIITVILLNHKSWILRASILDKTDALGWEVVNLFSDFDRDGDDYLSFDEAVPLILQFVDKSKGKNSNLNADVLPDEDVVVVQARFSPLDLSTMTKDWEHDFSNNESFRGLFSWQSPHIPMKEFGVSRFKDLLPEDLENIPSPGTVYTIVRAPSGLFGYSSLPSNRYYPPRETGRGQSVHRLLSMLHPHPFVVMRFPPQGVLGCVRAVSDDFVEVVFRMHAEFQLNEPPAFPFWFTPAQFTGSLLMSRDGARVQHFHLYVPNERRLNIDMEWLNEVDKVESMEVDIGYLPLMELVSLGPSRPQNQNSENSVNLPEFENDRETAEMRIDWKSEISSQEARDALELHLFPFKETLAADPSLPFSSLAQSFVDIYEFPVMMVVSLSDGTVVHKINANDFLDMEHSLMEHGFSDPSSYKYYQFLREGIKKAEDRLH